MEAQQLNVKKFEADLKAYDSETKRLTALSTASGVQPVSPDLHAVVRQYIDEILAEGLPEDADEEQTGLLEPEQEPLQNPQAL